ncbi:MAG: hypothetical protein OZSIB_3397 [Candidatus Ozemobacter sibiricus]|uniref:Tetratricopeptide repeat protein n=1 Tax=Candidatus Ozemobacter sibiricus TaxID=2268124 RepID=A0A367ZPZ5_9BACT|nr:MAG: hypothetical protein OZSIB_3397 [Candidatus Ozemobacter sibiricus]
MRRFRRALGLSTPVVALACLAILGWHLCTAGPAPALAGEMPRPLREAAGLFQAGRFDEARTLALSVHRAFPREIEPLLLLGRIDVAAGRLADAWTWIRLAGAISPRHPLVQTYRQLFAAWEHRHGPLTTDYLPLPGPDPDLTARRFRKGWFGPSFLHTAPRLDSALATAPVPIATPLGSAPPTLEPILSRSSLYPTSDRLVRDGWARDAEDALARHQFLPAYLLYSKLLSAEPDRPTWLVGKARSCLGLGRFREAVTLLDPFVAGERELDNSLSREMVDELYRQARAGPATRQRRWPRPDDRRP